jgi:FHS family glucose/mannose:H+ symporter-like MFS transporter
MTRNSKFFLTASCFLSFFSFGFIDNLKGPILPELMRSENLSLVQGGTVFFGAYMGFILATLLTGFIADTLGNRRVLLLAGVCLCLGLFGSSMVHSYPFLILCMSVVGLGLGAIEVGANGLIVELHRDNPGRYLNLLATFHGTGSFLVPLYVAWLIHLQMSWQNIFASAVVLAGLVTVAFFAASNSSAPQPKKEAKWNFGEIFHVGFGGSMGWYYLLISSYVAVELGVGAWLMEYLQKIRGQSVSQSSYYLSGFFVMIMLGRLFGSLVVERLGYLRMVGIALLSGTICLSAGLLGPDSFLIGLPLSGACFSIVFPTITAVVTSLHKENIGTILGVLFTFGGLGGALGPWIIGFVSQSQGLKVGLCATIAFCMIALFSLLILIQKQK